MTDDEQPTIACPACGREEPDFDGFLLAHVKPAYEHGCGWCSHPSVDDGVCGICGEDLAAGAADDSTPVTRAIAAAIEASTDIVPSPAERVVLLRRVLVAIGTVVP